MKKGRYHILAGSFVVAVMFWFSVTMGDSYRMQYEIPLTVTNMPRDLAFYRPLPDNISVMLQANGWQLLFLSAGKPVVFEIPGEALRNRFILTNRVLGEMLKLPPGVQAIRAYPDTLFMYVDRFEEKKVPLRANNISVSFKSDFGLIRSIEMIPDSVTLKGSGRVLRNIESWPVEARTYENLSIPVADELPLLDSLPGVVKFDINKTTLYIPTEQMAEMVFDGIPVTIRGVPSDREVLFSSQSINVTVRGGVNVLSALNSDDFKAILTFDTILADTSGNVIPTLVLPTGLQLLRIDPTEIRYTIRR